MYAAAEDGPTVGPASPVALTGEPPANPPSDSSSAQGRAAPSSPEAAAIEQSTQLSVAGSTEQLDHEKRLTTEREAAQRRETMRAAAAAAADMAQAAAAADAAQAAAAADAAQVAAEASAAWQAEEAVAVQQAYSQLQRQEMILQEAAQRAKQQLEGELAAEWAAATAARQAAEAALHAANAAKAALEREAIAAAQRARDQLAAERPATLQLLAPAVAERSTCAAAGHGQALTPPVAPPTFVDSIAAAAPAAGAAPELTRAPGAGGADGRKRCATCGKRHGEAGVARLRLCAGCKVVRYCSTDCQLADWPRHEPACGGNALAADAD